MMALPTWPGSDNLSPAALNAMSNAIRLTGCGLFLPDHKRLISPLPVSYPTNPDFSIPVRPLRGNVLFLKAHLKNSVGYSFGLKLSFRAYDVSVDLDELSVSDTTGSWYTWGFDMTGVLMLAAFGEPGGYFGFLDGRAKTDGPPVTDTLEIQGILLADGTSINPFDYGDPPL